MTRRPSVIIAGAGIVGATLAYHLASAGVSVTLVERSRPASGVTARSFAWINIIHGNAPDLARLRNPAIADYRRLERELNGALAIDWNGALTWPASPAESERLVTEHVAWGYDVRLVERDEIRRLEPHLAAPPPVAAHAPGEGALDPVAATLTLVHAAVEAGAQLVEGTEVQELALWRRPCRQPYADGSRDELLHGNSANPIPCSEFGSYADPHVSVRSTRRCRALLEGIAASSPIRIDKRRPDVLTFAHVHDSIPQTAW